MLIILKNSFNLKLSNLNLRIFFYLIILISLNCFIFLINSGANKGFIRLLAIILKIGI